MAERPSVKEILAAVRRGGPAKPAAEPVSQAEREAGPPEPAPEEPMEVSSAPEPPPAAAAPSAPPLPRPAGRPLTLKEKLAAARAGGPAKPSPAPAAAPESPPAEAEPAVAEEAAAPTPAPAPPPAPSGRPLTLKEKLAAARSGAAAPAAPAGAKPAAAAKAAPAAAAKAVPAATRTLPPLEKMTDPRDLAEALRRAGAEKEKAAKAAAAAKAAEAAGATPSMAAAAGKAATAPVKAAKAVPPRPSKDAALATAQAERRGFLAGLAVSWIAIGWGAFTAGMAAFTAMTVRFMFPNVLAEPPSTIKVGVPSNFEKGEVNERWKAEWGFWIVRSSLYDGIDKIYAIKSICTHLGCPPNWLSAEQKFKCPCHGSGFYISGVNFEGPAPRPLERYKITLADDGQLLIDKTQIFQEELGQWTDPDSFIAV